MRAASNTGEKSDALCPLGAALNLWVLWHFEESIQLERVMPATANFLCCGFIFLTHSDGMGVTGTFCTIFMVLDRLKTEQSIDVFQAVKKIRVTRAGMVQTLVSASNLIGKGLQSL